ncbi:SMP-30/gluconolactonase/LRE family protein [Allohahella marinimesophila]|uniref:SMP-30/gluconolactonase/LRE family protein n=1 Tax=Allohahella marinimesophila TaxID=1054972 RepID=A0ABP7PD48_9GAMM
MRSVALFVLAIVLCALVFLTTLWLNAPINALAWHPESPQQAPQTESLQQIPVLASGKLAGAEDVHPVREADREQWLVYTGMANGEIIRIAKDERIEVLADTGGHPLGLALDTEDRLVIADAERGLLRLDLDTLALETLAPRGGPMQLNFVDDVDIAANGVIYFSDASSGRDMDELQLEILEARPRGRLFAYDPAAAEGERLSLLLDKLYFANGVAVTADQQSVLVNETFRYRVTRYWLDGPKKGESEVFADRLPGFPDGISRGSDGRYWVALFAPRNSALDNAHPYPVLKELMAALPESLQPEAARHGAVLGLNEEGDIIASLQDPSGEHVWEITSVEEADDGTLYLGTLTGDRIGALPAID